MRYRNTIQYDTIQYDAAIQLIRYRQGRRETTLIGGGGGVHWINFYKIARILLDALTTTNVATCDRIFPYFARIFPVFKIFFNRNTIRYDTIRCRNTTDMIPQYDTIQYDTIHVLYHIQVHYTLPSSFTQSIHSISAFLLVFCQFPFFPPTRLIISSWVETSKNSKLDFKLILMTRVCSFSHLGRWFIILCLLKTPVRRWIIYINLLSGMSS